MTSRSTRRAATSTRSSRSRATTEGRTAGSWATDRSRRPRCRAGARRRTRARRLLDRRPGAAGDLPRARHRVTGVTWVLVAFNLVMALAAVPAAHLGARRRARAGGGRRPGGLRRRQPRLRRFADLEHADRRPLRAGARRRRGGHRGAGAAARDGRLRAPRRRGLGGAPGRPARRSGPAVGGLLTELVSWQSIFLAAGAAGDRRRACRSSRSPGTRRRPGSSRGAAPSRPPAPARQPRPGAGLGGASPRLSSCSCCC